MKVFPQGLGAGAKVCMDRDMLCCPTSIACPLCPQILSPILPGICLCSYSIFFHQLPQAWHFLSSASRDLPFFRPLSWVPVGRKGAGPGIRASTQWLAQSSEVRKREREPSTPFLATHPEKTALNCFVPIGVPVKFCTTTCLHWKTDRD